MHVIGTAGHVDHAEEEVRADEAAAAGNQNVHWELVMGSWERSNLVGIRKRMCFRPSPHERGVGWRSAELHLPGWGMGRHRPN